MNNREREQAREELGRWKELRKEKIKKPQDQNWIPSVSQLTVLSTSSTRISSSFHTERGPTKSCEERRAGKKLFL